MKVKRREEALEKALEAEGSQRRARKIDQTLRLLSFKTIPRFGACEEEFFLLRRVLPESRRVDGTRLGNGEGRRRKEIPVTKSPFYPFRRRGTEDKGAL